VHVRARFPLPDARPPVISPKTDAEVARHFDDAHHFLHRLRVADDVPEAPRSRKLALQNHQVSRVVRFAQRAVQQRPSTAPLNGFRCTRRGRFDRGYRALFAPLRDDIARNIVQLFAQFVSEVPDRSAWKLHVRDQFRVEIGKF